MKNIRLSVVLALLCGVAAGRIQADPISSSQPPVNAFSLGIASSAVAITSDPSVVYWNPGGIGLLKELAVDISFAATTLESPGSWSFLMTNSSDNMGNQFGFGILRRHYRLRESTCKSFTLFMPLAYPIVTGKLPIGVNVKFISESVDDSRWHYGMGLDIGAVWRTDSGIQIGMSRLNAAGSNLGSYAGESWLGLAWSGESMPITVSTQTRFEKPFDGGYLSENLSGGVDVALPGPTGAGKKGGYFWKVRAGYKRERTDRWLTMGFEAGKGGDDIHIAYSMAVNARGWKDRIHLLTYGYNVAGRKTPHGGFISSLR